MANKELDYYLYVNKPPISKRIISFTSSKEDSSQNLEEKVPKPEKKGYNI